MSIVEILNSFQANLSDFSIEGNDLICSKPDGSCKSISFVRSQWDSSIYIDLKYETKDGGVFGGRLGPEGVDYLDYSWSDDALREKSSVSNLVDQIVDVWFEYIELNSQNIDSCYLDHKSKIIREMVFFLGQSFRLVESEFDFFFIRKKAELWQVVQPEIISNGAFVVVRVGHWFPLLEGEDFSFSELEDLTSPRLINGGFVSFEGVYERPRTVYFADDFSKLSKDFSNVGMGFLESIKTIEDFKKTVPQHYKSSTYFEHLFKSMGP